MNNNRIKYYLIIIIVVLFSCKNDADLREKSKMEIMKTEKEFAKMVNEDGIKEAFLQYADENAVLNRNNSIIKGYDSIKAHFDHIDKSGVKLEWSPDFVDVSSSGDLGYTYGAYTYSMIDSAGETTESKGIFHTVWKKQKDGSWKFVWD